MARNFAGDIHGSQSGIKEVPVSDSPVSYSLDSKVATIRLDDGKANAMNLAMFAALNDALDQAAKDQAVVLLCGRERMFSAGYDLATFQSGREVIAKTLRAGGGIISKLLTFPFPVVIGCEGHAIAQGAFTLMGADVRIGARGPFKVGLNEVVLGLTIPHYGVEAARLRLTAPGFHHAATTGTLYTPERALSAGFFDEIVEPAEVMALASAEAQRLTKLDMTAHAATKLRVRGDVAKQMLVGVEAEFPLEG
ncbi:MAG: enoyl-CoA hydratase [Myxococcota bacterium]|jgi:enoyl-CoA hydratase